ncbi:DUF3866 family protein [Brevibacillus sp. NRS-1366]|uniref:DUF3866 family protein n=1 Tax=Brevibacillus sp. NRS-1366 TaxID=3233899 RepID=UPI003D1D833B
MLRLATGTVIQVVENRPGLQRIEVRIEGREQNEQALSFSNEIYAVGESLLLNTTAVKLQLGTGGYHLIVGKAGVREEQDVVPNEWGHVMKMRYAPWQLAVDTVEEQSSPYHEIFVRDDLSLEGTPVIISELHSMLPITIAALKERHPDDKIVYIMPDGASLPIAMSGHVHHLRQTNLLDATITAGHSWGGDHEAVTIHSALLAARHIEKAAVIICMLGPGVAGTGTSYGFSGVQLAEVIHAVSVLGGIPFFIPRISFSDKRSRHYGVSHHTRTILGRYTLRPVLLPMPRLGDQRDELLQQQIFRLHNENKHTIIWGDVTSQQRLAALEESYGLSFSTMGRSWRKDPVPFQTAVLAADQISECRSFFLDEPSDDPYWFSSPNILARIGLFLTRNEELL